jgi:hypothetical protein
MLSGLLIPSSELSVPLQILARLVPLIDAEDLLVPVFRDGTAAAERLPYLALLAAHAAALPALREPDPPRARLAGNCGWPRRRALTAWSSCPR